MESDIVYLDLETENLLADVGYSPSQLKMSVGVLFQERKKNFLKFASNEYVLLGIDELIDGLFQAETIVGFNLLHFDYFVLQSMTMRDLSMLRTKTIDLQALLKARHGRKKGMSLDNLGKHTLRMETFYDSKRMPEYWRNREYEKVMKHCRRDVTIIRGLYLKAQRDNHLLFFDDEKKKSVSLEIDILPQQEQEYLVPEKIPVMLHILKLSNGETKLWVEQESQLSPDTFKNKFVEPVRGLGYQFDREFKRNEKTLFPNFSMEKELKCLKMFFIVNVVEGAGNCVLCKKPIYEDWIEHETNCEGDSRYFHAKCYDEYNTICSHREDLRTCFWCGLMILDEPIGPTSDDEYCCKDCFEEYGKPPS